MIPRRFVAGDLLDLLGVAFFGSFAKFRRDLRGIDDLLRVSNNTAERERQQGGKKSNRE